MAKTLDVTKEPSPCYSGAKKKRALRLAFLCERVRELVVELELGEAVVNRVARALDAVIIVIAGILEIECQRCTVLRG